MSPFLKGKCLSLHDYHTEYPLNPLTELTIGRHRVSQEVPWTNLYTTREAP